MHAAVGKHHPHLEPVPLHVGVLDVWVVPRTRAPDPAGGVEIRGPVLHVDQIIEVVAPPGRAEGAPDHLSLEAGVLAGGEIGLPVGVGVDIPQFAVVVEGELKARVAAPSGRQRGQRHPQHHVAVFRVDRLDVRQLVGTGRLKAPLGRIRTLGPQGGRPQPQHRRQDRSRHQPLRRGSHRLLLSFLSLIQAKAAVFGGRTHAGLRISSLTTSTPSS